MIARFPSPPPLASSPFPFNALFSIPSEEKLGDFFKTKKERLFFFVFFFFLFFFFFFFFPPSTPRLCVCGCIVPLLGKREGRTGRAIDFPAAGEREKQRRAKQEVDRRLARNFPPPSLPPSRAKRNVCRSSLAQLFSSLGYIRCQVWPIRLGYYEAFTTDVTCSLYYSYTILLLYLAGFFHITYITNHLVFYFFFSLLHRLSLPICECLALYLPPSRV